MLMAGRIAMTAATRKKDLGNGLKILVIHFGFPILGS